MLTIDGIHIGGTNPCRFVAELSCNHGGDFDRALRLIDAAKASGADFVKFQCYTPAELVALRGDGPAPDPWGKDGWSMKALYEKARTPVEWFPSLFQYARDIGIVPFSSVFGLESLHVLERCACPAYKIARLDNHHSALIEATVSRGKPVFVSRYKRPDIFSLTIPPNHFDDERWNPDRNVWPLWCPPNYPSAPEDAKLPWFPQAEKFGVRGGVVIGLSSHCMDPRLPLAAVARGCKLIEMHFMLDDEPSELEANVSLTALQFQRMIADVRATETMLA